MTRKTLLAALLGLISVAVHPAQTARAQNGQTLASIDVYLDCGRGQCDFNYIRREIPYVNWVTERTAAHLHILVTTEQTGSGGRAYKLNYIGLRQFAAVSDTLHFTTSGTDTDEERRVGLTRKIKEGLVPYLSRTSVSERMNITVSRISETEPQTANPINDPWNSWIFGINGSGEYDAEESNDNLRLSGGFSANRTTEEWKLLFRARMDYRERNFDIGDDVVTSITRNGSFWAYIVKSIAPQWSLGVSSYTSTSTTQNSKLSSSLAPALEFSLFPYSESSERAITLVYELRFQTVEYEELTVFDKTHEKLLQQSLKLNIDYRQPWGSAHADVEGANYITDFESARTEYYRVEMGAGMSVRLVRGLNVNFGVGYDLVKDQLYLVKETLTEEEILLGTKRLPTSYEYNIQVGFSYSFGSIYNNVVNSRLNPY